VLVAQHFACPPRRWILELPQQCECLGFRVEGLSFRLGFGVEGLGIGSVIKIQSLGFRPELP
jgi:hypothetical protein